MSSNAPKPGPFAPLPFVTDLAKDEVKTQCAAICYRRIFKGSDEIEVLLITSRDSGRWVIPKGWPMRKKKLHQVARQEAWEEAGVRGHVQKTPFGHFSYLKKVSKDEVFPCLVQAHLLTVSKLEKDFPEKGQRQIKWFSPAEAALAVEEPGLRRLFNNLPYHAEPEPTSS
ncbi:NUDIX hydrolase [Rhizobium rhizogenes]|uniref:NUDIX hydrolase n=1 Tax=Rhizobium rhizogenes TaxID=359 RepID=UPI001571A3BB|nr:NUDIX hydrolase [Rhizobium rhizogenes]